MATKTPQKSKAENTFSLISNRKLQQMYSTMLQYRILESHIRTAGGKVSLRGKEAILVGATIDLLPDDALAISGDLEAADFLKKAPLKGILAQLHQRTKKSKRKKAPKSERGLLSSSEASQAGIASGIALANSRNSSSDITLAFLSDTSDRGGTYAFARIHKLPIIYVNIGAGLNEVEAKGYGFPIIPVDGNDVVAVYRVAFECIQRARQGGGPSMLACTTFPLNLSGAKSQDPIRNMEKYLSAKNLFSESWKQQLIQSFEKDVKQTFAIARKMASEQKQVKALAHVFPLA
jgi:TPP-dependent pyruvate/acetoin dehydrogenase alpha subunit